VGAGVLAFGDSITHGGGELQLGVALQSWALWTARGLGLPYTPYAVDGATVAGVVGDQIPRFERVNADPQARYELGCLYIGTNDVRTEDWEVGSFGDGFNAALGFLARRCERTLTATIPLSMGRPPDVARITAANAVIARGAARHGSLVLDLSDFRARNLMMVDHVHPTALGQVAIAERALRLLASDGMTLRTSPGDLVAPSRDRRVRLRADLTYAYRAVRQGLGQRFRA
jgi:lysophospholipase L1-like esterase